MPKAGIAPEGVVEFDELKGKSILTLHGKVFERSCHHHICMMNGIDAQHLQTVHKLDIEMQVSLHQNQSGTIIDFTFSLFMSPKKDKEFSGVF